MGISHTTESFTVTTAGYGSSCKGLAAAVCSRLTALGFTAQLTAVTDTEAAYEGKIAIDGYGTVGFKNSTRTLYVRCYLSETEYEEYSFGYAIMNSALTYVFLLRIVWNADVLLIQLSGTDSDDVPTVYAAFMLLAKVVDTITGIEYQGVYTASGQHEPGTLYIIRLDGLGVHRTMSPAALPELAISNEVYTMQAFTADHAMYFKGMQCLGNTMQAFIEDGAGNKYEALGKIMFRYA